MTNKIEITRDLLEDFLNHRDNGDWYNGVWITHLDRLRSLLAAPAVERQEPVAWRYTIDNQWMFTDIPPEDWLNPVTTDDEVTPLYLHPAEQPAPVAVVPVLSFVDGIEAAAKFVEKRMDDYVNEHGSEDPETGSLELPGTGDEYVGELMEIADSIRALACLDKVKELNQ